MSGSPHVKQDTAPSVWRRTAYNRNLRLRALLSDLSLALAALIAGVCCELILSKMF